MQGMSEDLRDFFTIVIPTLNEEDNLPKLLKDLKRQSFQSFHVVVVDGYSSDKTQEIARKEGAEIVLSRKRNVSFQRNLGAKNAKSKWLVFMDADNRIPKTYLSLIEKYISSRSPDVVSTWMKPSTRSGKDKVSATLMNLFMDINKSSKKPYIMESMVFVNTKAFHKIGGFDPKIFWREGRKFMEKAKETGMTFAFLKNPKYTYSFRRIKKVGTFKMFQEMSQMEIIKLIYGRELSSKEGDLLYPMKGGSFYKEEGKGKLSLSQLISLLFQDEKIDKESLKSLQKGLNSRKRLFK